MGIHRRGGRQGKDQLLWDACMNEQALIRIRKPQNAHFEGPRRPLHVHPGLLSAFRGERAADQIGDCRHDGAKVTRTEQSPAVRRGIAVSNVENDGACIFDLCPQSPGPAGGAMAEYEVLPKGLLALVEVPLRLGVHISTAPNVWRGALWAEDFRGCRRRGS